MACGCCLCKVCCNDGAGTGQGGLPTTLYMSVNWTCIGCSDGAPPSGNFVITLPQLYCIPGFNNVVYANGASEGETGTGTGGEGWGLGDLIEFPSGCFCSPAFYVRGFVDVQCTDENNPEVIGNYLILTEPPGTANTCHLKGSGFDNGSVYTPNVCSCSPNLSGTQRIGYYFTPPDNDVCRIEFDWTLLCTAPMGFRAAGPSKLPRGTTSINLSAVKKGPPCKYVGDELTGPERQARGLGHARRWTYCLHEEKPLGDAVCACKGCGKNCPGYEAAVTDPVG